MKTVGYVDMWEDTVQGPLSILSNPNSFSDACRKTIAKKGNGFLHIDEIAAKHAVELRIPKEAEILICSEFGSSRYALAQTNCKLVLVLCYEPTSQVPDSKLDPCTTPSKVYYLSSRLSDGDESILYIPLFVIFYGQSVLQELSIPRPLPSTSVPFSKRKDCLTLISNTSASYRKTFLEGLMKHIQVDNYGKLLKNATSPLAETVWYDPRLVDLVKQYKCVLTMENTSLVGYHTEKICHGFRAQSVPIYWGDPLITRVFAPESFIEITKGKEDRAYKAIQTVCSNESAWRRMVEAQVFQSDGWSRIRYNVAKLERLFQ